MNQHKKTRTRKPKSIIELMVFYDGECLVCWHQMKKYQKLLPKGTQFVDIQEPDFSTKKYRLKTAEVKKHLHIRLNGKTMVGMKAIATLWSLNPDTKALAELAQNPIAYQVMNFGYQQFSKIRPWLPKRDQTVCTNKYCEL